MCVPTSDMHRSERYHFRQSPFVQASVAAIRIKIISIEHYFWCKQRQHPNYGQESMKVIPFCFCTTTTTMTTAMICSVHAGACILRVYAPSTYSQSLCNVCTILWPGFPTLFFCSSLSSCFCFCGGHRKIALETLFQLCDWDIFRRVRNWDILERYVDEEDQMEAFNQIASDIDENAKICAWHRRTSCDEYFRPIVTNEGRCYTFVNDPCLSYSLTHVSLVSNHSFIKFSSIAQLVHHHISLHPHAKFTFVWIFSFHASRIYWIPMKYSPEGKLTISFSFANPFIHEFFK